MKQGQSMEMPIHMMREAKKMPSTAMASLPRAPVAGSRRKPNITTTASSSTRLRFLALRPISVLTCDMLDTLLKNSL